MLSYEIERNKLLDAGKKLLSMDVLKGQEGNFSIKLDQNKLLISPAGQKIIDLTPEKLIICDLEGNVLSGEGTPSSGLPMHSVIYINRPEVEAVIHTHSVAATSFAIANKPIPNCWEVLKNNVGGEVPVASPYAPVGTYELADRIKQNMSDSFAILLQNHGVLCYGRNIEHAVKVSFVVEMAAKMALNSMIISEPTILKDEAT